MNIVGYLKNIINKIKNKNELLLDPPKEIYKDLINTEQIDTMISNIPANLSEIEKAYYIYLELGKIVNESPRFVFADRRQKEQYYNDRMDSEYYGICKSISELYVSILKDERIGISADLVKKDQKSSITHIDTILKIDGKNYIANLISDLSRIKTSRRVNSFCFDLGGMGKQPRIRVENQSYLKRLEAYYGKIDNLTRKEIEQLDKKLGYSFSRLEFTKDSERGLYTEDTIELLKRDMNNLELFREYVLHNQNVPQEDILKYKLDYIFENINKLASYNGNIEYLENIRWYLSVAKKILSPEESSRIQSYVVTVGNDTSNIISILKLKSTNGLEDKSNNFYYMYSNKDRKYVGKTSKEIKEFVDSIDKDSLNIIGTFDRFNPRDIGELEL